jgi:hypothetical protein
MIQDTFVQDTLLQQKPAQDSPLIVLRQAPDNKESDLIVPGEIFREETADSQSPEQLIPGPASFGYIDIKCKPWANVFIDSLFIDTTPVKEPYKILAGQYLLQLQHPDYPEYKSSITVAGNDTLKINVNLHSLVGYLICNVFPWGDIYINDNFKGQTPLNRPIILEPGKHILEVKNPGYETEKSEIFIEKSDTLRMTIKLNALVNSR